MQMLQNPLFVKFIVYFNENQDYFECHEVLEEYWKSLSDSTKDHLLTAYILLSTGMYHFRRGNNIGARKTLQKAYTKMMTHSENFPDFIDGIDFNHLCNNLEHTINRLDENKPFKSFQIQINSQDLELLTNTMKHSIDLLPLGSEEVIHKHMLRDRSDILRIRDNRLNTSNDLK